MKECPHESNHFLAAGKTLKSLSEAAKPAAKDSKSDCLKKTAASKQLAKTLKSGPEGMSHHIILDCIKTCHILLHIIHSII